MKNIILKLTMLLLLGLFLSSYIPAYVSADDYSTGGFEHDSDNDVPVFTGVFDSTELVTPLLNVTFYVVVEDIDNTSTELTVTLYYSNDSFVVYNDSQIMTYDSEPSANNYQYMYEFMGQPAGTYLEYYYQAEDGYSNVKSCGNPDCYDIQWDLAPVGNPAIVGPNKLTIPAEEEEEEIEILDEKLMLSLIMLILILVGVLGTIKVQKYRENRY